MNILYVDIVSMPEHKVYNTGILRVLTLNNKVDICAAADYLTDYDHIGKYYSIPNKYIFSINKPKRHIQMEYRRRTFWAYNWVKNNVQIGEYDVLWFSYCEPITFWFQFNTCKIPVFYCDHLVGELSESKIKQYFFKHINRNYYYVYFEKYIGRYLHDTIKMHNRLCFVRHPLPKINYRKVKRKNLLFAPAQSNDEDFIKFLIDNVDEVPKDLCIKIRSNRYEYVSNSLVVYKTRIPDEEYYSTMLSCAGVILHYGERYNYRTSTVWFESLVCHKVTYLYCGNTMRNYKECYPEITRGFIDNAEFLKQISKWREYMQLEEGLFEQPLKDYSDETILMQVENALGACKE